MKQSKAFAPANISCIFKIHENNDPRWAGSYGLGFTLDEGVIVSAKKSKKTVILFNKKKINFPAVEYAIKNLTGKDLTIDISTKLPLGCGFGLSGASALAASYAINELFDLERSQKNLAVIAHTADSASKTGLGDVVNQYYGGCCLKLKPSSYFEIVRIRLDTNQVHCRHFSGIDTKSIITNDRTIEKINKAATTALSQLKAMSLREKIIKLEDIISISKEFSVMSGLLRDKKVMSALNKIERNNAKGSMIMLGNSVFCNKPFEGSNSYMISNSGAYMIDK